MTTPLQSEPMSGSKALVRVLVTGATGYIGGRRRVPPDLRVDAPMSAPSH